VTFHVKPLFLIVQTAIKFLETQRFVSTTENLHGNYVWKSVADIVSQFQRHYLQHRLPLKKAVHG